jgi:YVTN family beta-propeller protein
MVYVSNFGSRSVTVIDGATDSVVTNIPLSSPGSYPFEPDGIGVDPATNMVYVVDSDPNGMRVGVIDGSTNALIQTVQVPFQESGTTMHGLTVDAATDTIYATYYSSEFLGKVGTSSGNVVAISGSTDSVVAQPTVDGWPWGVVVNPSTDLVYSADQSGPPSNSYSLVAVISGPTDSVTTSINVPNQPYRAAVDTATNTLYVTQMNGSSVAVIDGATNTISAEIGVGASPSGVAVNSGTDTVYVDNAGSDTVSVIDGSSNQVVGTVPVGVDPYDIAVDSTTNTIYVTNNGDNTVSVMNGQPSSGTAAELRVNSQDGQVNPITGYDTVLYDSGGSFLGSGPTPATYALNAGQTYQVQADSQSGCLFDHWSNGDTTDPMAFTASSGLQVFTAVYNCPIDGERITTISTGSGSEPVYVGVNSVTHKVYAVEPYSDGVAVIDGSSNTLTKTIHLSTGPVGIGVNPVTDRIYVKNYSSSFTSATLAVIDGSSDSVISTVSGLGTGQGYIAVNPDTNRIYVASGDYLDVVDGGTNTLIASISLGSWAEGVAVDTATNLVYVTSWCYQCNYVYIVNGSTNSVVGNIPLSTSNIDGYGIAADSSTNTIYVATGDSSSYLYVINGATNTVTGQVPTGDTYNVAVNEATDKIYASNPFDNTVTMVDGSAGNAIVAKTPTGYYPWGVAVDMNKGKAFAADQGADEVTVISGAASPLPSRLAVASQDTGGNSVDGFYTMLYNSGGSVNSTGFTPVTFSTTAGDSYSVEVDGYGSCSFARWSDGATNDPRPMIASASPQAVTAVYNCAGGGATTSQLTISTQDPSGNPTTGFYTVLNQSGSVVATGFTTHAFTLNDGQTYTVQVDGYGSCAFGHWLDSGSTTFYRTVSIASNTAYTAVMSCGGSGGGSSSLTVDSVDSSGIPITGYYTVLRDSTGSVVQTGYTPATFATTSGASYSVEADSYGSCTFAHWSSGATADPITFTATSSPQTLTAIYNCGGSGGGGSSSVTVDSVDQNGSPITGYYVVLYDSSGSAIKTGYTPSTFATTAGQSYEIEADGYGSCTFVRWSSGASSDPMAFTATSSGQTFTAEYNCG